MKWRTAILSVAGVLLVGGVAYSVFDECLCTGDIHEGVVELGRVHFGPVESHRFPEDWNRGAGPLLPNSKVDDREAGSMGALSWLPQIDGVWFKTPLDFDFDGDGTSDVVGVEHAHCECLWGPSGCGRIVVLSGRTHGRLLAHRILLPLLDPETCGDFDHNGTQDLLVDEGAGDFVILGVR